MSRKALLSLTCLLVASNVFAGGNQSTITSSNVDRAVKEKYAHFFKNAQEKKQAAVRPTTKNAQLATKTERANQQAAALAKTDAAKASTSQKTPQVAKTEQHDHGLTTTKRGTIKVNDAKTRSAGLPNHLGLDRLDKSTAQSSVPVTSAKPGKVAKKTEDKPIQKQLAKRDTKKEANTFLHLDRDSDYDPFSDRNEFDFELELDF